MGWIQNYVTGTLPPSTKNKMLFRGAFFTEPWLSSFAGVSRQGPEF